ncbi:hypothetical protein VO57_015490 [Citromicrobium bathyomarinum]|nr:hypothetical protein [Citromicrobium sp. JL2201]KPM20431.1 hypothetical protein VO57_16060 [Citromicrobium sp. JL2201]
MSFKNDLAEAIAAEARLRILQQLAEQNDGQLSIVMLKRVLDSFGYRRDRDWIETQLRKLEAVGAVELFAPGGTMVARIARAGRDHIEERSVLGGVARPSEAE